MYLYRYQFTGCTPIRVDSPESRDHLCLVHGGIPVPRTDFRLQQTLGSSSPLTSPASAPSSPLFGTTSSHRHHHCYHHHRDNQQQFTHSEHQPGTVLGALCGLAHCTATHLPCGVRLSLPHFTGLYNLLRVTQLTKAKAGMPPN